MNDQCGLVHRANPCRCARKTRGFLEAGWVDADNLQFAGARLRQLREVARTRSEALSTLDGQYGEIFRQHPFYESPDFRQRSDGCSKVPNSSGPPTNPDRPRDVTPRSSKGAPIGSRVTGRPEVPLGDRRSR